MFTRTELHTAVTMVRSKKLFLYQPLTIQFSQDPNSEADLYFFRGAKKHYENGAHFWLRCITWLEDSWQGFQLLSAQRYPARGRPKAGRVNVHTDFFTDEYNLCEPIAPESFHVVIEGYSLELKKADIPHTYHWEGGVQQAMQMSNEWNDQSFVAQTESEFLAFHWVTQS
jgi:hypothetical protein